MTRFGKFAPLTGRPILALALALSLAPAIARAGSSPTYCHNEATNPGGPSRCGSQATGITQSIPLDVLCDGARTCSKAFFCQGRPGSPIRGPLAPRPTATTSQPTSRDPPGAPDRTSTWRATGGEPAPSQDRGRGAFARAIPATPPSSGSAAVPFDGVKAPIGGLAADQRPRRAIIDENHVCPGVGGMRRMHNAVARHSIFMAEAG